MFHISMGSAEIQNGAFFGQNVLFFFVLGCFLFYNFCRLFHYLKRRNTIEVVRNIPNHVTLKFCIWPKNPTTIMSC